MSKVGQIPPSKGEWAAIGGYEPQYSLAAQFILRAAQEGVLREVRLIDPNANTADDFQIVSDQRIDAYQVKWEKLPSGFTFANLLDLIAGLTLGRLQLKKLYPNCRVVVHILTNCPPSTSDTIKNSMGSKVGSFFEFRSEILEPSRNANVPTRESLDKWEDAISQLSATIGLNNTEFAELLRDLYVDVHAELASDRTDIIGASPNVSMPDVERVKAYLLRRVRESSGNRVIEIAAQDILLGAGLGDRLDLRNRHEFPKPDIDYHPIIASREQLASCLSSLPGGYLALVGPPGSGKSTLINEEFADPSLRIVRYYAFIPGSDLSGFIRGESEHFLHDLNLSLLRFGSHSLARTSPGGLSQKQDLLGHLAWLNKDFLASGRKTIIFIDGLDHIPREQKPTRSLLTDLPLPNQIPDGVFIVLGTQPVELNDLPIGIRQEIKSPERRIEMSRIAKEQVLEIVSAEYPEDAKVQSLADRLYALSEGHPLSLAILIRQLRQPPHSISPNDAIDRLADVNFVGTDIDGYYDRLWAGLTFDDVVFDFLGRSCRDRLPIKIKKSEAELGRLRLESLLKSLGHLWQQDPLGHLHVFHNSFRLFLLRLTGSNVLGNYDSSKHLGYHRELVEIYRTSNDPLDSWEVAYHLSELMDDRAALDFVTIDRVREQLENFRLPTTLFPDIRTLIRVAIREQDLVKVAELGIAWNELNLCEHAIGGQYDAIATELLNAGEYRIALQMMTDGQATKLAKSTCLKAAEKLLNAGLDREARILFHAAEPIGQLHEPEFDSSKDCLDDWIRIGIKFRRPENILGMIRKAALRSRHSGIKDSEGIRQRLLTKFAVLLTDRDALQRELDVELRNSRSWWLTFQLERINATNNIDQRRAIAREVIDTYRDIEPGSLEVWQRLLVAEMATFLCEDLDAARRMLIKFPTLSSDDFGHHDKFSQGQHHWFRLFRLREQLGERPDIAEIELDKDNEFRKTTGFVTKHIAKLGTLVSKRRKGQLPTSELISEVEMTLRFMGQRTGTRFADDRFNFVRSLRPAFLELVFDRLSDRQSISELAKLFISSMAGEHGEAWFPGERLVGFHHFVDAGVDCQICNSLLRDIERDWPTDQPDASSRADREVRMAGAKNALGIRDEAIQHLRLAVASYGTVEHRKDHQQSDWCRFLCDANLMDTDESRRRRRTILTVQAVVAASQTEAPSEDAARTAIADATRWNPQEGVALVDYLPSLRAINFASAASAFVAAVVRSDEKCGRIATAITRCFLLPLDGPDMELLSAIATTCHGEMLIGSIASAVNPFSLQENRTTWYRKLVAASYESGFKPPSIAQAAIDSAQAVGENNDTVSVGLNEKIKVADLCSRIQTPADFRKFHSEISDRDWVRTNSLTEALCRKWETSQIVELSKIIMEYDKDGGEIMICAETLARLGESAKAIDLSTLVLMNCSSKYGQDWQWGGSLLRAMNLLEKLVDRSELRRRVIQGLSRFVQSGGEFSSNCTELFAEIFPRICNQGEMLAIADHIEQFLKHAARVVAPEDKWFRDRSSAREALLEFVGRRLSDPVNFVAEAARLTLVELMNSRELTEQDLLFLTKTVGDDPRQVRGLLAVLISVSHDDRDSLRPLASWLIERSKIRDFGLRSEANQILASLGINASLAQKISPDLLKSFASEPLVMPQPIVDEEVSSTGYLRDTDDPHRLVELFLPQIEELSRLARLESSKVIKRVYDIAESYGRETWSKRAEEKLRDRLEKSSLQMTFTRLRSIAVERAIHQAASELIDGGRLDDQHIQVLSTVLPSSDASLLRIPLDEFPETLPKFLPPSAYSSENLGKWLQECESASKVMRRLLLRRLSQGVVLAEYSSFRSGREAFREKRISNLWIEGDLPDDGEKLIPFDFSPYASQYQDAETTHGSIAIRHFPLMEFHGSHREWIALNANVAQSLGFSPDDRRLFGWTDGEDWIWTVRWINGHPLVPPDEGIRSHGWLLVGTNGVAKKLSNAFDDVQRFCLIHRQRGDDTLDNSTAFWNEPHIDEL